MQCLALLATFTVTFAPAVNLTDMHAFDMRVHLSHILKLGHRQIFLAPFLAARGWIGRRRSCPSLHHLKPFWGVYIFFHAESDNGFEDGERIVAMVRSALFGKEVKLCWVLDGESRWIRFVVITDSTIMPTSTSTAGPTPLSAIKSYHFRRTLLRSLLRSQKWPNRHRLLEFHLLFDPRIES